MKCGKYILVKAPENYPGRKYREKYCYEHHLIWWKKYGRLPEKGKCLHHKDENTHNNIISNLEEINWKEHCGLHTRNRGRELVKLKCPECGNIFIKGKNHTHLQNINKATFCCRICSGKFKFRSKSDKEIRISENVVKEFRGINIGSRNKPILKNGSVG